MKTLNAIRTLALASGIWVVAASVALAKPPDHAVAKGLSKNKYAAVPEIDASSGLLAIAVLVSATLLAMEVRRRRRG